MKTCKIIPVFRKPVQHILPYGKIISVPTQMPLNDNQLLKATMQANVYEVIEGRGDVLLTRMNRNADNSNAPIVLGLPEIVDYFDENGNKVDASEVEDKKKEAPIVEEKPVEQPKVETTVEQPKKEELKTEEVTSDIPTENKVSEVEEKKEEAPAAEEKPVEQPKVETHVEQKQQPKQQNKNNKK